MNKTRMEAFSDGVIAIIITIMVLELKVPHGTELSALAPLWPVFASYVLSFVNIGIYWNNHHHLLQPVRQIKGAVLWANLHLLFWLSLFPFVTGWMGENHFAPVPAALYGANALMAAFARAHCRRRQRLRACARDGTRHQGHRIRGVICRGDTACVRRKLDCHRALRLVGVIWFIPDPRIERRVAK